MLDINVYLTDKKTTKKINDKLDKIIKILENPSDIEGLDKIIDDISEVTKKVKSIVQ